MAPVPHTDLDVAPLFLGGNVFGWTAPAQDTFAVLDRYVAAGGNAVDTADTYDGSARIAGGEPSEVVLGRWLTGRSDRDDLVIATKVGNQGGLGREHIRARCERSLQRLGLDHIDLYFAHQPDADTPLEESLGAFDELVREGKVRHLGASNHTPEQLAAALEVQEREGFARFAVVQQYYNLLEREFEGAERDLCERLGIATFPYFALALGFLTGKYRPGATDHDTWRADRAAAYLEDERGLRVLAALDDVAGARDVPQASVALAWLHQQPTVAAPIASARNAEQLEALLPALTLELDAGELERLTVAGAS